MFFALIFHPCGLLCELLEIAIYNNPLALDGIKIRLLSIIKDHKKMAGYLLLRDNKESGPYTMDDLLNFGLKPYDLVWVQGKSAAWRYPSEIEELKPFAPAIEEQPFDRFYKKNNDEKKEEFPTPVEQHYVSPPVGKKEELPDNNEYSRYAPAAKEEIKFTPKKSVFVTLPDRKQVQEAVKKEVQPVQPTPVPSPAISITENSAAAEIKYSQPLDEIKERYVKTLLDRKDKKAKKGFIVSLLKKAAVFVGLIALGILAGFFFKSKQGKENAIARQMLQATPLVNNNTVDIPSSSASFQKDDAPVTKAPVEKVQQDEETEPVQKIKEAVKINEEQEPTTVRIRKETMLIVPKEKKEDFPARQPQFSQRPSETDPITGERNSKVRTANDNAMEEKAVMRSGKNSLHDLVSVSSNDYKRVAFGGIRNLYLTVTNNSKYELDHVIVELQYLKPSEEPLRTENVKFKSIAPNASATIKIPDTNRGIKVSYKIINIDTKHADGVALKF